MTVDYTSLLKSEVVERRDESAQRNEGSSSPQSGLSAKHEGMRDAGPLSDLPAETETKPPYRALGWYDSFFDLLQQRKLSRVDLDFIQHNIASDKSDARKFRTGLVFLGLIDDSGFPTKKLEGLYLTGEDFRKNLETVIRDAYAPLFQTIVIERAKRESVVNFLIQKYSYNPPQAERAVQLFVHFCGKAGIPLSPDLVESSKKSTDLDPKTPRVRLGPKRQTKQESNMQPSRDESDSRQGLDDSFATLEFDDFVFKVRRDPEAIQFARSQVNSLLDYLTSRTKQNKFPPSE